MSINGHWGNGGIPSLQGGIDGEEQVHQTRTNVLLAFTLGNACQF